MTTQRKRARRGGGRKGRRFRYKLGDDPRARRLHATWYRGTHCNFTPSQQNLAESRAIDDYIIAGWAPPKPIIETDASILAVGSCFAQHIVRHLRKTRRRMRVNDGMNVNVLAYGAGFVNTFTLRQQFEWALGERDIERSTLFVEKEENAAGIPILKQLDTDETSRAHSREVILSADAYILTLGLSEVWYERDTGAVFFGAVPTEIYDANKHAFRVTTVAENHHNLRALYSTLRKHKPDAPIVFTLSPVPLTATFRPVSCITANNVSKAILRVAVDELMRGSDESGGDDKLFYWPSYEIVTEFYGPAKAYGEDRRHITDDVIGTIMGAFERHFIKGER